MSLTLAEKETHRFLLGPASSTERKVLLHAILSRRTITAAPIIGNKSFQTNPNMKPKTLQPL